MSRRGQQTPQGSTACAPYKEDCTLSFASRSRCAKQPLYRPAALRRNDAPVSVQPRKPATPPLTPSLSSTDLNRSWLSGITAVAASAAAPWSPLAVADRDFRWDGVAPCGVAIAKSLWKPDDEALQCDDRGCAARFGLIERRHHCRRCGNVFCASHSSHTTLLYSSPEDLPSSTLPTPRETPRTTPRSSMLDIPSLISVGSPSSSGFSALSLSSSQSSSNITISSPKQSRTPSPQRICDACYFSVPAINTPPLTSSSSHHFVFSTNPVALRRQTTSPLHSPGGSPPYESPLYASSRRARKDSSTSSGGGYGSSSTHSSPPSSVDSSTNATVGKHSVRGVSPAASVRGLAPSTVHEEEGGEEQAELGGGVQGARAKNAYGSLPWQVNWATF